MGLRNRTFPSVKVEIPGGDPLAVRGVNPDMVVALYHRHQGELSTLFDHFANRSPDVPAMTIIPELIGSAPLIMAELIALAAGCSPDEGFVDPDLTINPLGLTDWERDVAWVRALSMPVQIDALTKIAEQTFSSDMPAGKFLAVVIQMAGSTAAVLTPAS